jgi:putative tryptophan/tyrosine transport system substrate-binding protein
MDNHRRRRMLFAISGLLFAPLAALAQPASKLRRVGLLWIGSEENAPYLKVFRDTLRAQGYVEGASIQIDDRFLVNGYDQIQKAAIDLVAENPDVIVTFGATATLEAYRATKRIPIVTASAGDPVKLGVVQSLQRPGGNVTGLGSRSEELNGKRLELLREVVPSIRRVAVVFYPGSSAEVRGLQAYESAGRVLNLEVVPIEIRSALEISPQIAGITRLNVQGVALVGSTLFSASRKQFISAITQSGLPAVYTGSDWSDAGGLVSYGTNVANRFRRAAQYVDKILKGATPGDLPIEQGDTMDLVVNMKAANRLGIKVPQSVLVRADRIIE